MAEHQVTVACLHGSCLICKARVERIIAEAEVNVTEVRLNKIKEGDRVRLKAVELAGEETGKVVGVNGSLQTICVELDWQFCEGRFDDGLREITADQILEIIK